LRLTVNDRRHDDLRASVGGSVAPLASLTTNAAGTTAINGGAVTTTGCADHNDAVTLGAATLITGVGNTFGWHGERRLRADGERQRHDGVRRPRPVAVFTPLASLTTKEAREALGAETT